MDDRLAPLYCDRERVALLSRLRGTLESEVTEALNSFPHVDRIYFRVKSTPSFVEKALDPDTSPPYSDPFVEIEDQVAGRVLFFFEGDIENAKPLLLRTFTTVEQVHKRPSRDEEFGYESHHLICNIPPHLRPPGWDARSDLPPTFELQLRTLFMHAYAEPQHDIAYKRSTDLPGDVRRELAWIAASSWGADKAYSRVWAWYVSTLSASERPHRRA
jgi:putative GTP pyrophosphokinase